MINARADVVGSLLRPPELLSAQKQLVAGGLTPAEFKRIEDRAVDQAIELQEEAGLEVVTDISFKEKEQKGGAATSNSTVTFSLFSQSMVGDSQS